MIEGKKVLGVIVARGGSVRLPKKNLLKIGNNTLLGHAIKQAKNSKFIDKIICSTDDNEIKSNAIKNGCPVPFLRPKYLASNKATAKELMEYICKKVDYHDYLVIIQPTSPLRISEDIDNALNLCQKEKAYSVVSVTKNSKISKWLYYLHDNNQLYPFIKTNKKKLEKELFVLNGAVYVLRYENIIKQKELISKKTFAYKMPVERSIDIDTKLDFEIAKLIYHGKHI